MSELHSSFFEQISKKYLRTTAEKSLFEFAVQKMRNTVDPLHDEKHIQAMLQRFDDLIQSSKLKIDQLTQRNTVLSIAWHDVWISQYIPSFLIKIWYTQMIEGIACARLFHTYAQQFHLEKNQIDECAYAIRKHSNYQVFELNSEVARILFDLDWLEFYSVTRFKRTRAALRKRGKLLVFEWTWLHAFFGKLYMDLRAHRPESFYHDWAKESFLQHQKKYQQYAQQLIDQTKKNSYFSPFLKYF